MKHYWFVFKKTGNEPLCIHYVNAESQNVKLQWTSYSPPGMKNTYAMPSSHCKWSIFSICLNGLNGGFVTAYKKKLPQLQLSWQKTCLLSGAWRVSTNLKCVHKECDVNTHKHTCVCLHAQHILYVHLFIKHTHTHKHERTYSHMLEAAVGGPRWGRNTLMDNDRVWQQESELSHSGRAGNE